MKIDRTSQSWFLRVSAGLMLAFVAAKAITLIFLRPPLLHQTDPVFGLPNEVVLGLAAMMEALVVLGLLSRIAPRIKLVALAALSFQFLLYRLLAGDIHYCSCLGTVLAGVPVLAGREWLISLTVAVLFFTGSVSFLLKLRLAGDCSAPPLHEHPEAP